MAYTVVAEPTHPGTYWYQSAAMTREVLVDVRLKDSALLACSISCGSNPARRVYALQSPRTGTTLPYPITSR